MEENYIKGSEFNYFIDTSYGLSKDGFIARGTESIVYKGLKKSNSGDIVLSCVLKFKHKVMKIGADEGKVRVIPVYERFKKHDLKIFDDLQDCRSVVRIFDVIENLGDFYVINTHVAAGEKSQIINGESFFCVVEEFIDGWSLEEYCRDEYWKLTDTVDVGSNQKEKIPFCEFSAEKQARILKSYKDDYDEIIRYQSEIFDFMINLCEIMKYVTDRKHILHLDIKPDNIMITKHGKELVLIDFGRSEYLDPEENTVKSNLGAADYNKKETLYRMFQYGTLGFAAPECFAKPFTGSCFPFDDFGMKIGEMSVESDIFSFGATFWECLNIFELCTGSNKFYQDKSLGGSSEFYSEYLLNDQAYCNRDLSLTSPHYHEKLEAIIKKCTRKRVPGYLESPNYYHDYDELKQDIQKAKESAPAIVKTENLKVRNSFGVVGVMAGLLVVLVMVCSFFKLTGSYFAEQKLDTIISDYNSTKIELLQEAALEQIKSSTDTERQDIYNKVYEFFSVEGDSLDYSETAVLIDLLKEIHNIQFVDDAVDKILLNVNSKDFSNCIENTVTSLNNCTSEGFNIAVHIYNAQKRIDLKECYIVLCENDSNGRYRRLVLRLAQDLNHDEQISAIANSQVEDNPEYSGLNDSQRNIAIAEIKNEIRTTLNNISRN